MNPFSYFFNEALFRPLFNLLVGITNVFPGHHMGVSILVVTFLVRLLLLPPSLHQARAMSRNQIKMQELKKEIDQINKRHKDDKAARAEATMRLYKEAGVNPASGCLPLLVQLPIFFALYRVFSLNLSPESFDYLYSFVARPDTVNTVFLGIELTSASVVLAIVAGLFQFFHMKMISPSSSAAATPSADDDTAQMMQSMQKNMAYIFPVMTVFISLQLPAALALYWVASTIFGIIQQYVFKRYLNVSGPVSV